MLATLAQLVEQQTENLRVWGSIPRGGIANSLRGKELANQSKTADSPKVKLGCIWAVSNLPLAFFSLWMYYLPMVLPIVLGVIVFAGVIYMAISKKSDFKVRLAALVALGFMVLTVIISIILIFGVAVVETDATVWLDMPPPDTPPQTGPNNNALWMFIIFLLVMFFLVLILSLREQRKKEKMTEKYKTIAKASEDSPAEE